jgi:hypothetical protein
LGKGQAVLVEHLQIAPHLQHRQVLGVPEEQMVLAEVVLLAALAALPAVAVVQIQTHSPVPLAVVEQSESFGPAKHVHSHRQIQVIYESLY